MPHEDFHKYDPKAGLHRKILNSLRWFNIVVNGAELTGKLMETIGAASNDVIVSCPRPELLPKNFMRSWELHVDFGLTRNLCFEMTTLKQG